MNRLKGKIVLITGAGAGIGEACAKLMATEGALVVVTDIDQKNAERVAKEIGPNACFYKHDVAEENEWLKVFESINKKFNRLDVLVNNAGVTGHEFGLQDPENLELEAWHKVHKINLDSIFLGCKYAIKNMKKTGGGSIINMSSRSGMVGVPSLSAYASSKAAIRNHTKSVALYCAEKKYNIRCNSIHPATIYTQLWENLLGKDEKLAAKLSALEKTIPLQCFGKPEDVAYMVVYLASDEAAYVTGSEFVIDGGILAGSAASPGK